MYVVHASRLILTRSAACLQADARHRVEVAAAETNRQMSLSRAHEAWRGEQVERAAADRSLKAEVRAARCCQKTGVRMLV